ncbi:ABC transporter ATP-binding protein [Marinivivus vitaminiproducens]|uniref:ABC transporter ATP-binding protein n=1 Tax=Marinivivus vitaminiproducens TaxID=3035935 RepID=UPI0027AB43C2|nr:ABC transporter ATP-binding protein [Geminicoccaceae bacterium SCSIO 64248]
MTDAPPPAMVRIEGVSKSFSGAYAVRDVSFALERGRFLTILGPSGSGKSTLLRMIAGFVMPDSGAIVINDQPVAALPAHRRSIGMVFQRLALFPHLTAAENVAYPLRMRGFDRNEIGPRVERYLELVRLHGLGKRRIGALSGGQQQRVAIARALVYQPDLLLLDEPLAALDRKLREDMQLEFRRIQKELGVTTINVTHDQREALVMSDDILVMNHGRTQQHGAPAVTYRAPANRFVAGFIGVTNFLPARVVGGDEGMVRVAVGKTLLNGRPGPGVGAPEQMVEAAIRAEQVRIGVNLPELDADLEGVVEDVVYEGERQVYSLRVPVLADATIRAFAHDPDPGALHAVGSTVRVGWRSVDLKVFAQEDA